LFSPLFYFPKEDKKEQEELVKVSVFLMRKKTKESNNHWDAIVD